MQPDIRKQFETIERQRHALCESVPASGDPQLCWKPNAETWSIQQVVEHLVLSDETLGQAQDAGTIQPEALMFRILPRTLRRTLIFAAFRRNAVLPLPSPAVDPSGNIPLPDLLKRWEASRAKMRQDLETATQSMPCYSHPVLGPLTPGQMMELAQAHTAYHARQMEALRRGQS